MVQNKTSSKKGRKKERKKERGRERKKEREKEKGRKELREGRKERNKERKPKPTNKILYWVEPWLNVSLAYTDTWVLSPTPSEKFKLKRWFSE